MFGAIGNQKKLEYITHHLAHTKEIHMNVYRRTVAENDVNVTQFLESRIDEKNSSNGNSFII